jgi:hypothetical protein
MPFSLDHRLHEAQALQCQNRLERLAKGKSQILKYFSNTYMSPLPRCRGLVRQVSSRRAMLAVVPEAEARAESKEPRQPLSLSLQRKVAGCALRPRHRGSRCFLLRRWQCNDGDADPSRNDGRGSGGGRGTQMCTYPSRSLRLRWSILGRHADARDLAEGAAAVAAAVCGP